MYAQAMNRPSMATIIKTSNTVDEKTDEDSRDEVDHCATFTTHQQITLYKPTTENQTNKTKNIFASLQKNLQYASHNEPDETPTVNHPANNTKTTTITTTTTTATRRKGSFPSLENLPIFHFQRKRGGSAPVIHTVTAAPAKERPPFVKSSSIARLFGNTYNTKRHERTTAAATTATVANGGTVSASSLKSESNPSKHQSHHHHHPERFQACEAEPEFTMAAPATVVQTPLLDTDLVASANPFRSLSRGLGRLLWKKSYSVSISEPDPEFKVAYLGNVLTGWAKGDSCMEKPLATLWRNYTQNYKPDVSMRVKICPSGLKATTRQHGLTEYWSHRITHCSSPKNYPKVFCWIYRHEGRKLKHELRCHAVLCAKESIADSIAKTLQDNLTRALKEFKRDKMNKQNARLSLVNSVYENPSMPQRKILLSVGSTNYRPPLERSKSAPRLMVIEETGEEPDEDDESYGEGGKEPPRRQCCTMDPLYPAMTLGRRRCKRGHSIRRNGNRHTRKPPTLKAAAEKVRFHETIVTIPDQRVEDDSAGRLRIGSDSGDDLDKILMRKDYDTASPLADELMSYFDMKFSTKTSSMLDLQPAAADDDQPTHRYHTVRASLSLDNLDSYSDEGEDVADDLFFNQDRILSTLIRNSTRSSSMTQRHLVDSDEADNAVDADEPPAIGSNGPTNTHTVPTCDSDEGSISSGFDTASTVTGTADVQTTKCDAEHNQNSLECSSVRTTPLATVKAVKPYRNPRSASSDLHPSSDSDESDFSDESGYVEYQQESMTALPTSETNHNRCPLDNAKSQSNSMRTNQPTKQDQLLTEQF